ncbi:MAG: hypothetical protein GY832_06460 [Chloroflexi bacterium]|nr:hypothetical protein [Chloroflexota bacterium]
MNAHVVTDLLAYLDGELDERERAHVEAHLAECSYCAAELEELRVVQQELDATFDAALTPVRLPAAADARIWSQLSTRTKPRPLWRLWQQRGLIAQALLAVLVLAFFVTTQQTISLPLPAGLQETLVLGQDRLAPGSKAALRVLVRTADEVAPIEGAEIVVLIGRTPGLASIVYTGRTDANGTAEVAFTVPEDLEGEASLVVETSSTDGEDRIVRPITIARDYKLFLSSDKPAYRPGQTIHARVLALDAVNLRPATGQEIVFIVLDRTDQALERHAVTSSDFGVAAFDFTLPSHAAHGPYTLQALLGDTVSERTVDVGAYELPAFRVTAETGRAFYGPGEWVTGLIQAEYFFGRPVAGSQVTLRGYVRAPERVQAIQVLGETDAQGRYEFDFDLPSYFDFSGTNGSVGFDLEIVVLDAAGQWVGMRHVVPIAAQPIIISAVPESGLFKPGVENVVYILTSYPDGRPAETNVTILANGQEHLLPTGPYGLAEFTYTPSAATTQLDIYALDARGTEGSAVFTFESDQAALLLRAEKAAYEVGDTLRAEVLLGGVGESAAQSVYLDVVRARQTIATLSTPVEDGRAVFALDLDGTMVGTLELNAYHVLSDGSIVRGTRLVVVDAPRQVLVAVAADRDQYHPGDTAHLQIQTAITATDQSTSQPTQSMLGIGVVDESVYALETQPPSFARTYFLLDQELLRRRAPGLNLPTLLDAKAEMRVAQDVAARAAWAGAPVPDFTLSAKSVTLPQNDTAARVALSNKLSIALALLPLILSVIVVRGLGPTGVLSSALRRVLVGGLMLCLASPLVALVVGGAMWALWAVLGVGAPVAILLVIAVLVAGLAIHGWLRRDTRAQLAAGLLTAYLVLGGMLVGLAVRGGDPGGLLLALIAATFLLTVAALATLGQGLVLEGWQRSGWATTLLGLLLIPLVVYLPFVPGLASDLTRTVGNPALYTGPVGWLTGCGPAATPETIVQEVEVEVTRVVEGETVVETVTEYVEVTVAPEEPAELTAAPMSTQEMVIPTPTTVLPATQTLEPTPTLLPPTVVPPTTPIPPTGEAFPLRQIFPETLYWNAEALTDENGCLALDLPLADNVTNWRLAALASTRDGELGVATYDIIVFQDFFVDLDLPSLIIQGEEITVTVALYNYLPQAQTVQVEPSPARWYTLVSPPQALTIPPNNIATATFVIRAEQSGQFSVQVTAIGERMSDAVVRDVTVQ